MGLDDIQKRLDKVATNSFNAGCGTIMILGLDEVRSVRRRRRR